MPLNNTEEERELEANRQLADKIRLEQPVIRDFRRLFKQMGKDLEAFFSVTNRVPDAEEYSDDVKAILLPHYRKVANAFGGTLMEFLETAPTDEPVLEALATIAVESNRDIEAVLSDIEAQVTIQTRAFIRESVDAQTAKITGTNQNQLSRSVSEAIATLSEGNGAASSTEVAAEANSEFVRVSTPRAETIAATTTQEAAEGVKSIEQNIFSETLIAAGFAQVSTKAWVTVGDDRVRQAHSLANGQTQPVNQPFVVMGQLLRFPGDSALGATASNVMRCRCSSLLIIGIDITRTSFNLGLRG